LPFVDKSLYEFGMSAPDFAETYERALVPSLFGPWAQDLLDRVRLAPGDRVLDLACGTGIVARLARQKLGSRPRIAGVDVNPEMIAVARSIEPDISWHQASAVELPFESGIFDVVICQQGLQFFPDRAAAVREMRRVLADRGRVAISTWRPIEENPLFYGLHAAMEYQFGPRIDRRFSFADERAICALLIEQGFTEIKPQILERVHFFPDAEGFLSLNLWAVISELYEISKDERLNAIARLKDDAAETLDRFASGSGLRHPMRANIVTAAVI
jgi:ubiquinone/menaquinone biosynthesis C-methylase UbiE